MSIFWKGCQKSVLPIYQWVILAKPEGSQATLSDTGAAQIKFVADLPGEYAIQLTIRDAATGAEDDDTIVLQQVDTTPPVITISATPVTLWPPNGKMVPVTIAGKITDAISGVDASTATYAVTDEYGLVQPSGHITLGSNGSYTFTVQLQASRHGNDKDGRQYIITVSAQDNAGNTGSAVTGVTVPHDQGH
jgi:hypothetical protein